MNQKDKVAIHLSEIRSCDVTIHINDTLWADFLNKHVSKGKRKKFKTSFDDFVSLELQQQGVLCWLKHNFYWFNKSTEYCWRGKFRCIDKNCQIVYNCAIKKNNNIGVNVEVKWEKLQATHVKLTKAKRCIGASRKIVSTHLLAYGNSNVRQDHLLQNLLQNNCNISLLFIKNR